MNAIDWHAAMNGMSTEQIVLPLVFVTVPGVAVSRGLRKFRKGMPPKRRKGVQNPAAAARPGGAAGAAQAKATQEPSKPNREQRKAQRKTRRAETLKRAAVHSANLVTCTAMVAAGLGLVPATLVAYRALAPVHKYAPAIIGLVLLVALAVRALMTVKDLRDGRVDKPSLWLTPLPIFAVLWVAAPVVWHQATDQASHSAKMMFTGHKEHANHGHHAPKKHAEHKRATHHGSDGQK